MKSPGYLITFFLLLFAQIVVNNFLSLPQYLILSILPALIVFQSFTSKPVLTMIITFVIAFLTDFFSDGSLGLTAVALLPVAFLRQHIIGFSMGRENLTRDEWLNVQRIGMGRVFFAITIAQALFLAIYIFVDSAGTRSFGFNALKWAISLTAGTLASFMAVSLLSNREKWS